MNAVRIIIRHAWNPSGTDHVETWLSTLIVDDPDLFAVLSSGGKGDGFSHSTVIGAEPVKLEDGK